MGISNTPQDVAHAITQLQQRIESLENSNREANETCLTLTQRLDTLQISFGDQLKKITEEMLSTFDNVNKTLMSQSSMQKDMLNLVKSEIQLRSKQQLSSLKIGGADSIEHDENVKKSTFDLEQQQLQKTFSKLPADLLNRGLTKPLLMRLSVVYEFIDTELDYVRDLNTILTFHQPQVKQSGLITEHDTSKLFSNIAELYEVNQAFAAGLSSRRDQNIQVEEIGDVILSCAENLKVYTVYCGNYPHAIRLLRVLQSNSAFKEILAKWTSAQESRGLNLESFLIKPVQRICKYPLLIRELLKFTDPSQKDHFSLTQAMEKIEAVVTLVNESTKSLGEYDRLVALLSKIDLLPSVMIEDKKLLKDGVVSRAAGGKSKERYFVLLHDLLIVCKPIHKFKSEYETKIPICDISLQFMKPPTDKRTLALMVFTDKAEQWNITCASEEEKNKWQDMFSEAIKLIVPDLRRDFDKVRSQTTSRLSLLSNNQSKKSLIQKKGQRFENCTGSVIESDLPMIDEPEYYENGDHKWKRTVSGTGQYYFYNLTTKETSWSLPAKAIPIYSKPVTFQTDAGDVIIQSVPGYPQWRQVKRDGLLYFFNALTWETKANVLDIAASS